MSEGPTRREAMALAGALALPDVTVAPAAPDLGNLYEPLAWIAKSRPPSLSFLEPKWRALEAWKAAARPLLHSRLGYDPPALPLGAQVTGREERDGVVIESVRIRATTAYDIPAKVLLPAKRRARLPGVVALHCHSGRYQWGHEKVVSSRADSPELTAFRQNTYGRPYGEVLARRGYVVVVIDAFYFGSRRLRVEALDATAAHPEMREPLAALRALKPGTAEWLTAADKLCGRYEHLTAKTIFAAGATWPGILAWDDRRSLDYLASRPEVDPQRLGCVGLSIGGLRAAHLAGADERIKAAVVAGWMTEFALQLRNHLRSHTWMVYVPELHGALDLPDVAALCAPGALLVQQCSQDQLYPMAAMKAAVEKLTRIYAKAGHADRFRGTFHDQPHSFRPAMQDEAFAWLDRWL
jgi:dienelactone hydrolase